MRGIAYGVGVGPGDPELMTLKAVRLIKENEVIALPGKEPKETVAYTIAQAAVPEIEDKELIPIYMPMTYDEEELRRWREAGARKIEEYLEQGKNVVYLTLGDSTVYCTFSYLQRILQADGYETELVNGITSFTACAASLNLPISVWNESVHILPGAHSLEKGLSEDGTVILMKSGKKMSEVKEMIRRSGRQAMMVERCGMKDEKVYYSLDDIPDDAGYYSVIISRESTND